MEPFCALSTPAGKSGIAVIRASGDGVCEAVSGAIRILRTTGDRKGVDLRELGGYESAYAQLVDISTGKIIDNVVVTVYRAPHSYTGDDMMEISCHGGSAVRQEILRVLYECGIRPAGPGEFTKTAFINGKLDLTSAEAVMKVICADSSRLLEAANGQVLGALRERIEAVEGDLYKALSLLEMILEFPEHDDTPENTERISSILASCRNDIAKLEKSFNRGRLLTSRMKIAIVGIPNSGKSTLLNLFAGYGRAIVTDTPGTTRDTLEINSESDGIPVTFIDTAGIRETQDEIEEMGVERAQIAASEADLVFYLIAPDETPDEALATAEELDPAKTRVFFTKSDIGQNPREEEIRGDLAKAGFENFTRISAKTGENVEVVREYIRTFYENTDGLSGSDVIVLSDRQAELLKSASEKLDQAVRVLEDGIGEDICSQLVRGALDDTGEITGRVVTEELVENIFSDFCIGK